MQTLGANVHLHFNVSQFNSNNTMKKYIVVREFIQPNKIPRIIGQFETRDKAETFALGHEGKCWVYEMSM